MSKFKVTSKHFVIRFLTWVERRSIAFAHRAIAVHDPHRDALSGFGQVDERTRERRAFVRGTAEPVLVGSRLDRLIPPGLVEEPLQRVHGLPA